MRTGLVRALPAAALLVVSLAAPAAAGVFNGTSGPDELVGTRTADTIRGFSGNDILRGRGGADTIYGGRGSDRIYGGRDLKKDFLYGGPGGDRIYIRGYDHVYAGSGNDVIVRPDYSGAYPLYIWCGPGYDRVLANPWLIFGGGGCEKYE